MLKIKDLREEKGLTQKELAEKINSTNKNIWAYENEIANPPIDVLIKLSRVFNVPIDYLVGNSDELGNVVPGDDFNEEEKKLVLCYRGIGKAERLALMTTAQSFYNQAKENKRKVII